MNDINDLKFQQAAGLRQLADLLMNLAADVEAGHARYVEGDLNFNGDQDFEEDRSGAVVKLMPAATAGKLPKGVLTIKGNITFRTGQPKD